MDAITREPIDHGSMQIIVLKTLRQLGLNEDGQILGDDFSLEDFIDILANNWQERLGFSYENIVEGLKSSEITRQIKNGYDFMLINHLQSNVYEFVERYNSKPNSSKLDAQIDAEAQHMLSQIDFDYQAIAYETMRVLPNWLQSLHPKLNVKLATDLMQAGITYRQTSEIQDIRSSEQFLDDLAVVSRLSADSELQAKFFELAEVPDQLMFETEIAHELHQLPIEDVAQRTEKYRITGTVIPLNGGKKVAIF